MALRGEISELMVGRKRAAVETVRKSTGLGLIEARNYVDTLDGMIRLSERGTQEQFRDLFSIIDGMDAQRAVLFCASLLKETGSKKVKILSRSEEGVDILLERYGVKYAIWCQWDTCPLGEAPVREVMEGLKAFDRDVGLVLTNSTFTTEARELVQNDRMILWDRTQLEKLVSEAFDMFCQWLDLEEDRGFDGSDDDFWESHVMHVPEHPIQRSGGDVGRGSWRWI